MRTNVLFLGLAPPQSLNVIIISGAWMDAVGWGQATQNAGSRNYPTTARYIQSKVQARIVGNCGGLEYDPQSEFCHETRSEEFMCEGDDGDPIGLMPPYNDDRLDEYDWIQIGIQSRGHENCDARLTVATKVFYHRQWIRNQMH